MKKKKKLFKKKYLFTNSTLVFLSLFPLLICSLGLYGMMNRDIIRGDSNLQVVLASIALAPSLAILIVLSRIEAKHENKTQQRIQRKNWIKNYSKNTPINNGEGALSDTALKKAAEAVNREEGFPTPIAPESIEVLPGLTIKRGENPFRPVTDESIDETLKKLQDAKSKLARDVA